MVLTDTLHIDTISRNANRVEVVMPITPAVHQPFGYLHGGATIALLETAASMGAEDGSDLAVQRPFGIDVHVRHRKSGTSGLLHGVAELDRQEPSSAGGVKQFWNVVATDDEGDVVSDGVIVTKIVSLERLAEKERERAAARERAEATTAR